MEQNVAAYYNQTQNHYRRWWQLDKAMALHYGLWFDKTRTFNEALANTNFYLANLAQITKADHVLDAGCGVGGSAIFLAKTFGVEVTGISLSDMQIESAKANSFKHEVKDKSSFKVEDYCNTSFEDASFDIIWACESSSSAKDKKQMAIEWFRLLKPGGRLVLTDFFLANSNDAGAELLRLWCELWAMSPLVTVDSLTSTLSDSGFKITATEDLTKNIKKTTQRMYRSYWLGVMPSLIYNTLFGARTYARNHYKSGFYQYKSLQKNLWRYQSVLAIKP